MFVIPANAMVWVHCVELGDVVSSPVGPNNRWLFVEYDGMSVTISAAFVDTGGEDLDPLRIPSCASAKD